AAAPIPLLRSGSKTGNAVAALCERRKLSPRSAIGGHRRPLQNPQFRVTLRWCALRLLRGDSGFALRLSRLATRGISLRRNRAFRSAPDQCALPRRDIA